MATSPDTRPSLLVRIRDRSDRESWSRFVEIYAPAICGFLQRQGLQDADAADLTQDVMARVMEAIKSFDYEPQRGRFRGWLFTVAQNRLRNFWRDSARRLAGTGDTRAYQQLLAQPDERSDAAEQWDREYENHLFAYAAEQVRPTVHESTWRAFWSTAVEGESPKSVAARLQMTIASVRLAKARVLARIKHQIELFEGELP